MIKYLMSPKSYLVDMVASGGSHRIDRYRFYVHTTTGNI